MLVVDTHLSSFVFNFFFNIFTPRGRYGTADFDEQLLRVAKRGQHKFAAVCLRSAKICYRGLTQQTFCSSPANFCSSHLRPPLTLIPGFWSNWSVFVWTKKWANWSILSGFRSSFSLWLSLILPLFPLLN